MINGEKEYVYYASDKDHGTDWKSIVHGTKAGTCSFELTSEKDNQGCGFDEHVMRYCFEDRGKKKKNPLQKTGFDPLVSGPYKWKNLNRAMDAANDCQTIVHAELNTRKDFPNELMSALHEISHVVDGARMARFGSKKAKSFDTVFLDPYGDIGQGPQLPVPYPSDPYKMTIANFDSFTKLFKRNFFNFKDNKIAYQELAMRILPNMYFCVWNGKCGKLIEKKGDQTTASIIRDIIMPDVEF